MVAVVELACVPCKFAFQASILRRLVFPQATGTRPDATPHGPRAAPSSPQRLNATRSDALAAEKAVSRASPARDTPTTSLKGAASTIGRPGGRRGNEGPKRVNSSDACHASHFRELEPTRQQQSLPEPFRSFLSWRPSDSSLRLPTPVRCLRCRRWMPSFVVVVWGMRVMVWGLIWCRRLTLRWYLPLACLLAPRCWWSFFFSRESRWSAAHRHRPTDYRRDGRRESSRAAPPIDESVGRVGRSLGGGAPG
ncbi:uncharacterized protein J3D65DRAFT_231126 [Phyllosticta citribraziliensis]|uniref:Uncharacterized protein n=1 Tax=Phyllosticta citribraziliensis TaxID=989973 RepID=A0ABR1M747_9PEZI